MFSRLLSNLFRAKPRTTFQFKPRWKEELLVIGPGGSFVLDLPMGVLSAYLPTEENWQKNGPAWARELWPTLRNELEDWCKKNKAQFHLDPADYVVREEKSNGN
ncbi:hypothetical protein [uncultured Ruegeria sp.]|jgi:hypothetical protein|uniref:hypothetical protein n=1 Tax=uncultured Ruegeria sp. TaxID=259304 RepID=UPI00260D608E|nr:hypothetical protein [uncultured Ruegeria sp.]